MEIEIKVKPYALASSTTLAKSKNSESSPALSKDNKQDLFI